MLQPLKNFEMLALHATDGEIGHVEDFCFDDQQWVIRYVVVNTRRWVGRQVLISPISISGADWARRQLDVQLTCHQIRYSPSARSNEPFTPELERAYLAYFRYTPYWVGGRLWGFDDSPRSVTETAEAAEAPEAAREPASTREPRSATLRSVRDLRGSRVDARDGDCGRVEDLFIDEQNWLMRYLLIDTSNFLGRRTVLAPVKIVGSVNWTTHHLRLDTIGPRIRYAPRVDGTQPLDRRSEEAAEHHYAIATADVRQRVLGSRRGR